MRKCYLLMHLFFFGVLSVSAQGVSFGRFQQVKEMKAKVNKSVQAKLRNVLVTPMEVRPVEEYAEMEENRRYRYVYAYNTNMERSSETIYMSERENGEWGEEILYAVGTYMYEYDTQGRVKIKSVVYDKTDIPFDSYRVMVTYGDDSSTYTKYVYDDSGESYSEKESWTIRADGTLAHHAVYDENGSDSENVYVYDEQGCVCAYNSYRLSGTLNNRIVTYYDVEIPESSSAFHYCYDGKTGKLLEYWQHGSSMDNEKYMFEYDALGRIVSIKEYKGEDGYSYDSGITEGAMSKVSPSSNEPVWRLSMEENYIYWGEDIYAVNNPWKAVFGMDGPLKSVVCKEYDIYSESGDLNGDGIIDGQDVSCESESTITFERDLEGKLIAVGEIFNEEVDDNVISVDAEGYITSIKSEVDLSWVGGYDEEGYWDENKVSSYYSFEETSYVWEDGKIQKIKEQNRWSSNEGSGLVSDESTFTTILYYTDNSVIMSKVRDGQEGTNAEIKELSQVGNKYLARYWYGPVLAEGLNDGFDWESDDYIVREIQTEDVAFIRPNLKKDREGFAAEPPVVLSRAGRVVCVVNESLWSGIGFGFSEIDAAYYCSNIATEEDEYYTSADELLGVYYSISHEDGLTVASNIEGLPIYVLDGSRLLKEYRYYYSDSMASNESAVRSRSVAIPEGQSYDEISYIYDDEGLLIGQQLVSVDSDGIRTGEIVLDYKYETTDIVSTEATVSGRIRLSGRTLGLGEGLQFSVYTVGGQSLAVDVSSYTFDQQGFYIIVVGNDSIKLTVK